MGAKARSLIFSISLKAVRILELKIDVGYFSSHYMWAFVVFKGLKCVHSFVSIFQFLFSQYNDYSERPRLLPKHFKTK